MSSCVAVVVAVCDSKWLRYDSNEVVVIDSDPDVSFGTSIDHKDQYTLHEEHESDDNDYRDEDCSQCANSNVLCHDDKYESEDIDFT